MQASLNHGETISAMAISPSSSYLAFGSTGSSVILMERAGHEKAVNLPQQGGKDVVIPPYPPAPPAVSIPPSTLFNQGGSTVNPFNLYNMVVAPIVSDVGRGWLEGDVNMKPYKRVLSNKLLELKSEGVSKQDFITHLRASDLDIPPLPPGSNYNRFICDPDHGEKVYSLNCDPRNVGSERRVSSANKVIPLIYHKPHRPTSGPKQFSFTYSQHNSSLLFPGWDCNLPNDYANSVLLALFFIPEVRASCLREQFEERIFAEGVEKGVPKEGALSAELGEKRQGAKRRAEKARVLDGYGARSEATSSAA